MVMEQLSYFITKHKYVGNQLQHECAQCIFPVIPHGRGKVEGWSECRSRWQATLDSFTAIFSLSSLCFSFDLQNLSLTCFIFFCLLFSHLTFLLNNFCLVEFVLLVWGFVIFRAEVLKKKDSCCLFLVLFTSNKIATASLQRTSLSSMHSEKIAPHEVTTTLCRWSCSRFFWKADTVGLWWHTHNSLISSLLTTFSS